jgi:NAD(P)-dependent dehydrogenase (short-subunit alcohol dehydrogenase family)
MQGISDNVYLITGGARGIGRATAETLLAAGARVALADVRADAVEVTAREIDPSGNRAIGLALDVCDPAATARAVEEAERVLGPLAGLVACAGITGSAKAEDMSLATWQRVLDVNLTGMFLSCQAVARRLIPRRRGAIVTIGSLTGIGGQPGRANYAASKWGVIGLTKTMALEWGRHGLRVNCIAPNVIDTPLVMQGVPHDFINSVIVDRTPMARIGQPAEIATAALFLLSDAASYVNGVVLPVDGGISAGYLTHLHGAHYGSNAVPG